MEEEDEEKEPETSVVALAVRLVHKVDLVKIGDPLWQVMELHLWCKQDHHHAAAQTCRKDQMLPLNISCYRGIYKDYTGFSLAGC